MSWGRFFETSLLRELQRPTAQREITRHPINPQPSKHPSPPPERIKCRQSRALGELRSEGAVRLRFLYLGTTDIELVLIKGLNRSRVIPCGGDSEDCGHATLVVIVKFHRVSTLEYFASLRKTHSSFGFQRVCALE